MRTILIVNSLSLLTAAVLLTACGGGDSTAPAQVLLTCNSPEVPNAAGTACVAPQPIKCKAPTFPDAKNESCVIGYNPKLPSPVVTPAAEQAVIFFNKKGSYDGYRLHTWNNESCDAYLDSSLAKSWDNGLEPNGVDPVYGAYWLLNLKPGVAGKAGACGNFIIHVGTDDAGKAMGAGDFKMDLGPKEPAKVARMSFTFNGNASVFIYPVDSLGVQIADNAAHWLDKNTFVWNGDTSGVTKIKLHHAVQC